jgi:hypothetical protein
VNRSLDVILSEPKNPYNLPAAREVHRAFALLRMTEADAVLSDISQRTLTELLRGKGAHVDPIACVEDIAAEVAARQVTGFPHSIGRLVFHMNYWMDYELSRIRGQRPSYPEHNAESFPAASFLADGKEWDR